MHGSNVLNFKRNKDTSDEEVGKDLKKKYLGDKTVSARGNCHWVDYLWDRDRGIKNNYS